MLTHRNPQASVSKHPPSDNINPSDAIELRYSELIEVEALAVATTQRHEPAAPGASIVGQPGNPHLIAVPEHVAATAVQAAIIVAATAVQAAIIADARRGDAVTRAMAKAAAKRPSRPSRAEFDGHVNRQRLALGRAEALIDALARYYDERLIGDLRAFVAPVPIARSTFALDVAPEHIAATAVQAAILAERSTP